MKAPQMNSKVRPFLKWAGGKYRVLKYIKQVLPPGKRLIEPFIGSGAVFLNTAYQEYLLGDSNPDLINLYLYLQQEGTAFIDYCHHFFTPETNDSEFYYQSRDLFNSTPDARLKAALFLYLNRHSYNGLCRYNRAGGFNVPFGLYRHPVYFPEKEMLGFHLKSRSVPITFVAADFRETMKKAQPGDVIYADPPYVPLSTTADFTKYAAGAFGIADQQDLADLALELQRREVPVVISNHDTAFTVEAYRTAKILKFGVQRNISCHGQSRSKAAELLALFA
jgi:DNA adenine methylase